MVLKLSSQFTFFIEEVVNDSWTTPTPYPRTSRGRRQTSRERPTFCIFVAFSKWVLEPVPYDNFGVSSLKYELKKRFGTDLIQLDRLLIFRPNKIRPFINIPTRGTTSIIILYTIVSVQHISCFDMGVSSVI